MNTPFGVLSSKAESYEDIFADDNFYDDIKDLWDFIYLDTS